MTTSVTTRLSPFHSVFSSNGGEKSTGALTRTFSRKISKRCDAVEKPAISRGFSFSEAFEAVDWWDSSEKRRGRWFGRMTGAFPSKKTGLTLRGARPDDSLSGDDGATDSREDSRS